MIEFIHRWIFVDFWVPVWPNLAAAALCAVHITRQHRKHLRLYLGDQIGKDPEGEASSGSG